MQQAFSYELLKEWNFYLVSFVVVFNFMEKSGIYDPGYTTGIS